jgi:hypothetical protein
MRGCAQSGHAQVEDKEGEFDHLKTEYLEADNDEDMADDDAD